MNRMGLMPNDLPAFLQEFKKHPKLRLEGVMSHLADACNPTDDSFTYKQQEVFDNAVRTILGAGFKPTVMHLAASAGATKVSSRFVTHVRPGLAIYGINPLEEKDTKYLDLAPLSPVLKLKSTVIKITELKKGDKVGYGCAYTAARPTTIATLPLGYYEAMPWILSGAGCVTHGDQVLPIVGRVCMNHTMIDATGTGLKIGDKITVISSDPTQPNSVRSLQQNHGIFSYELLIHINETIHRKVV
jgi:alanine racemase